ncbi:MAG TPA: glycosyl transferase, partial [Gemmata sp.]|nr:glycosyl transferase [Gemmata sp.]
LKREGSHYLQEQALTAMLVADQSREEAPATEYVVRPTREETEQPTTILHHYVAESKAWYFRFGWRHCVRAHR